ncbi:MAG: ribbon-helix-helix protein, CopG family [Clostridia bacterium]|nr:ribbon-helix-helix protein, CopG family [Clostridia bacterium]
MDMERLILLPKRPKGEDGYKTFSIRIPEELLEQINSLSTRTNYSRNELICKLLSFAVDRCDVKEGN